MSQNLFLEAGLRDEDATVLQLKTQAAIEVAKFILARYPQQQTAAAKKLRLGQGDVSAILAGNLKRFSLEKILRIARRASLRLLLDMGHTADTADVQTVLASPSADTVTTEAKPLMAFIELSEASPALSGPIDATDVRNNWNG